MKVKLLISFLIYSYFFCSMENTCYRNNTFSLVPLFTEGIYGPIRSAYLLLVNDSINIFFEYVIYTLLNLNNIFGSLFFVFYIDLIFKYNLFKLIFINYKI
jgi:hypothetical protein